MVYGKNLAAVANVGFNSKTKRIAGPCLVIEGFLASGRSVGVRHEGGEVRHAAWQIVIGAVVQLVVGCLQAVVSRCTVH